MKIAPLGAINHNTTGLKTNKISAKNTSILFKNTSDVFQQSVSFGRKHWYDLPRSEEEESRSHIIPDSSHHYGKSDIYFRELACAVWDVYDEDLYVICKYAKPVIGNFFVEDKKKTKAVYDRLMSFVNEIRKEVDENSKIITEFESGESERYENLIDAKDRLKNSFFAPIANEGKGILSVVVPNGIIISGSLTQNRNEIMDWFKKQCASSEINVLMEEVDWQANEPDEFFEKLRNQLEASDKIYQATGQRTVIQLTNIDDLLQLEPSYKDTNFPRFKNIVEKAQEKYHATILINTEVSLMDVVDSAMIGAQRFPVKIICEKGQHTQEEIERYKLAKDIVESYAETEKDFFDKFAIRTAKDIPPSVQTKSYGDQLEDKIADRLMY